MDDDSDGDDEDFEEVKDEDAKIRRTPEAKDKMSGIIEKAEMWTSSKCEARTIRRA